MIYNANISEIVVAIINYCTINYEDFNPLEKPYRLCFASSDSFYEIYVTQRERDLFSKIYIENKVDLKVTKLNDKQSEFIVDDHKFLDEV